MQPTAMLGTFNDDFLAHRDPTFERVDLCSIILHSRWEKPC